MKSFFSTFAICFISACLFLFFGGTLIFRNFWAIAVFCALVLAVLISSFLHQETKIEELEARIKALETKDAS